MKATSHAQQLANLKAPAIAQLWKAGFGTDDIARRLGLEEHAVYNVFAHLKDQRGPSRSRRPA